MITIHVNGDERSVEAECTVERLLGEMHLAGPCAVEVNAAVVPRREHAGHALTEGDTVEIVTFVGGG